MTFDEPGSGSVPAVEQAERPRASPVRRACSLDELAQRRRCVLGIERLRASTISMLQRGANVAVLVEHVGDAAAHAGGEVAAGRAEHDHAPPVMYSQPWSPTPSTTALAPELRTAKRSPARPRKNASPRGGAVEGDVADDDVVLGLEAAPSGGRTASMPPERPLPT